MEPTLLSTPLPLSRLPATGSLSSEPKAPAAFGALQVAFSAFNSASVGSLKPLGHGLLTPFTPCHKLPFCPLRQSLGELSAKINLLSKGTSPELRVEVSLVCSAPSEPVDDVQFINWCSSLKRPH